MPTQKLPHITQRNFRDVLGNYPTGVAVVTAMGNGGEPIGMAVGSFTSVSLDPPLVAFLPDRGSSTFPAIREAGSFCVNVLAGGQEDVSRRFASRGADRFEGTKWRPAQETGSPVLEDAVAWIDCEIEDIHDAGDHQIVIGRVLDLDVQTPTLPLVFFQGGYGTFAPRSLVLADRGRVTETVRMADAARQDFEDLSAETGLECRVFAKDDTDDDNIVIIATAGTGNGIDPVGAVLPFFPPFGYTVAAWGTPATREKWYEAFPAKLSDEDRQSFERVLASVRRHGWALTFHSPVAREAYEVVKEMAKYGRTPSLQRRLVDVGQRITGLDDPSELDADTALKVRTITAPVMGPHGPVLHPTLYGIPEDSSLEFVERARDALVATCARLSERFGGNHTEVTS
ncbi:flavin reductase [Pseudarthrobacter siccitolerans]